jgi:hypothetical protein
MKPIWRARKAASSSSPIDQMSVPSSVTSPSLGRVSAPSMASKVDLPEPERPTMETNSPAPMRSVTSATAPKPAGP